MLLPVLRSELGHTAAELRRRSSKNNVWIKADNAANQRLNGGRSLQSSVIVMGIPGLFISLVRHQSELADSVCVCL